MLKLDNSTFYNGYTTWTQHCLTTMTGNVYRISWDQGPASHLGLLTAAVAACYLSACEYCKQQTLEAEGLGMWLTEVTNHYKEMVAHSGHCNKFGCTSWSSPCCTYISHCFGSNLPFIRAAKNTGNVSAQCTHVAKQ